MENYSVSGLSLMIPDSSHEAEYCRVMDRWELFGEKIYPPSIRRYSEKEGTNVTFSKWLMWCEDDRTTGSMLSNNIPCTFHFLINCDNEILGGVDINHDNTPRGHLHAGIVPWHRGKGYGTIMLKLALNRCSEMGIRYIQITPRKDNAGAIQTILRNGGILIEEFYDNDISVLRYQIDTHIK